MKINTGEKTVEVVKLRGFSKNQIMEKSLSHEILKKIVERRSRSGQQKQNSLTEVLYPDSIVRDAKTKQIYYRTLQKNTNRSMINDSYCRVVF